MDSGFDAPALHFRKLALGQSRRRESSAPMDKVPKRRFELAVVFAANPRLDALSRPIVKIVSDAQGNVVVPPLEVDLAQADVNGDYPRTIIKTADPDRYGINIGDYIV